METTNEVKETPERTEELNKNIEELKDAINKDSLESSILNNIVTFELEGKNYRLNRPTSAQKQEAYQKKIAQHMKFMKMKDENGEYVYYPEKELRKIYKERGISISEIEDTIKSLENKRNDYQEKLGKALTENVPTNQLDIYKDEIVKLNDEILEHYMNKNNLLEFSLENQSMSFLYEYLTYLILDVKNDKGEYEKAFKTFEEFRNMDNSITNQIGIQAGILLGSL
jgi:hypothetical protein